MVRAKKNLRWSTPRLDGKEHILEVGKVQFQSTSNPVPFTAWSECNNTVKAPPLDIIVPGLPVKALQNCPKDGAVVSLPSKISK